MERFTLAADTLGFTDGKKKKNLAHSEERAWPEENLSISSLEVTFKRTKIDRIPMKVFLTGCHQSGGRKWFQVPAAASLKEPRSVCCFHLRS